MTGAASLEQRTSEVLEHIAATHGTARLTLGELSAALGERSMGLLLLILALPNIVPGPYMPGFSLMLSVPICLLALQLARGWREPRLPRWLGRRSIGLDRFRGFVGYAAPWLRRLERFLTPRPSALASHSGLRLLGALLAITSVFLALPLPVCNWFPGLAIVVLGLGLVEDDGRALMIGVGIALASWLWVGGAMFLGAELLLGLGRLL